MSLLDHITVLEIAEGVSGPVCGLQLAELGATVIKIEPPGGDRVREWGPPLTSGSSAIFEHLNRGKRSIVLDVGNSRDQEQLEAMLPNVDAVIVQLDPPKRSIGPNWELIAERYPHLVICEISDVGDRGPLASISGSELICQALSGWWRYIGEVGQPPRRIGYEMAWAAAAMHSVQAMLAGLFWRSRSGQGQLVRVSTLGALLSLKTIVLLSQADPDTWEGYQVKGPHWPPETGYRTKDGQVTFEFRPQYRESWVAFCKAVGLDHLVDDPEFNDWYSTFHVGDRRFTHEHVYYPAFASKTSEEISALVSKLDGTSLKFNDYQEFLAHPQTKAIDPLISIPQAPEGARMQMGTPFRLSAAKVDRVNSPAPTLGQHAGERLVARAARDKARPSAIPAERISSQGTKLKGPLSGLRVLDASIGGVGPWVGVLLGELGADVVKLESPKGDFALIRKPTQKGFSTTYIALNLNKRGITLDMKEMAQREQAHALVRKADVFIQNFRPGVAERIGLGYETLAMLNPRLIYAAASGFGTVGPLATTGATDPHIQAFSGSTCVNGKPGGPRERIRRYGHFDVNTSLIVVQGVLTALLERESTGIGQRVDVTMVQAAMALQRVRIAEVLGGGNPAPMGSGTTYLVPDQAFATEDRYVAVSATSREQWQDLCNALSLPELISDPRFATNPFRITNREILIPILEERFLKFPAAHWIRTLEKAGVPCSPFMEFEDFRHHQHYLVNEFILTLPSDHWGDILVGGLPWRFSRTPGSVRPGSGVGEFTKEVVEGDWPDPMLSK